MAISPDPFNLIICGVGGQGNILVSRLIARALMRRGYFVTRGETFGSAQRSGGVFSSIRISSTETYGPLIPEGKAHLILGLEPLEALRMLQKYGNPEVMCLTNTYPVPPIGAILLEEESYPNLDELKQAIKSLTKKAWFVDATSMAAELDAPIVMNIVMMGVLLGSKQLPLNTEDMEIEIKDSFSAEAAELNLKAFKKGFAAIKTAA